ncbi:hypothetical protein ABZV78_18535 [Micromonospora sp. NPDC004540]|uniref:hypothetical protein n=1 Tax=Micromonospora sp. NPDC004540 TaxID=3154457 RepID=UPI0033ABA52D
MRTWLVDRGHPGAAETPAGPAGPTRRPGESAGAGDERMHEALVCVRLRVSTPGSRLLDFLRAEPCAVQAWWIAADLDAMVRFAAPSRQLLQRAVGDLGRRAGAEVVEVHSVLRPLDLAPSMVPAGPAPGVGGHSQPRRLKSR